MKSWIERYFSNPLRGKVLLWSRFARIYCDGGYPRFTWTPKLYRRIMDPYWGIKGFGILLFGRQIFFEIGEDKKGLY